MTSRLQLKYFDDGRLHLQDGPIDLIIEAWGELADIHAAYEAAAMRMRTVLDELCSELPKLRVRACRDTNFFGRVAGRMNTAVLAYAGHFITPMAAVAGAVADEVLAAMVAAAPLKRAYVNNGGDIALHLSPGESFAVGLVHLPDEPGLFGKALVNAQDSARGIATSGWRGRSFSLGIADAVTVLALSAADADAAATMIANAVDLPGHMAVARVAADQIDPQSDLGPLLVTRGVAELAGWEVASALHAGCATAETLITGGRVQSVALHLQGQTRVAGHIASLKARIS